MAVFDATALLLFLEPNAKPPLDPEAGTPIADVGARVEFLVKALEERHEAIVIPTPALSEVLVVHRHCIDGFFVGSIFVSAFVGIWTVPISTRADAEQAGSRSPMRRSGQRACPQVFGAMTGAAHMANFRGRKLYRVTLSAQERRDLKAIVDSTGAAWRRAQILTLRGRLSMPT